MQDVLLMGMANPAQKSAGMHMRLAARAFAFASDNSTGEPFMFVSLDTGMVGYVFKQRVLAALEKELGGAVYTNENLALSGTHSHSGPSGFLEYTIFQFAGSGWVPATMDAMVAGTVSAIVRAHHSLAPAVATLASTTVHNASINRSPSAYLRKCAAAPPGLEAGSATLRSLATPTTPPPPPLPASPAFLPAFHPPCTRRFPDAHLL